MKKITVFTVQLTNNNYLQHPVCQLCLNSWPRLIEQFKNIGYDCEIKIFNYDDDEVKLFYNTYPQYKDYPEAHLNLVSDVFRIWILSRYPNHLWLDSDIFVYYDHFNFIDQLYFNNPYCVMYNSTNLSFFKNILDWYLKQPKLQSDRVVIQKLNVNTINMKIPLSNIKHLYKLMRIQQPQKLLLVLNENDFEILKNNIQKLIDKYNDVLPHTFCFVCNDYYKHKIIKKLHSKITLTDNFISTYDDFNLINFIKSWHQTITINDLS